MTILKATSKGTAKHVQFIGEFQNKEEAHEAIKLLKAIGQWPKRHRAEIID